MAAAQVITDRRTLSRIAKAYVRGASYSELAEQHGVAITTIRNYILKQGIRPRSRGARKSA